MVLMQVVSIGVNSAMTASLGNSGDNTVDDMNSSTAVIALPPSGPDHSGNRLTNVPAGGESGRHAALSRKTS
jgi:hypothetical protein